MTRFITLQMTTPFKPAVGESAPIPMLVNTAAIVRAWPTTNPAPDHRSSLSLLGGDGSDVHVADEFAEITARLSTLIVGGPFAQFATPGLDLPAAAELLRNVLVGVEVLANDGNPSIFPLIMLDAMRDRVNQALALIGAESTIGPTPSGEPAIMSAAVVASLKPGDDVRVFDRELRVKWNGRIRRRGAAPAGLEIHFLEDAPLAGPHTVEHFDNTGRSVIQQSVPHPSIVGGSRYYIVDEKKNDHASVVEPPPFDSLHRDDQRRG